VRTSLKLTVARGALVQDVNAGSPGDRAGLRPYDTVVALDDRPMSSDDQLIHEIARRAPGSPVRLRVIRDGHEEAVTVKLAERPRREGGEARGSSRSSPADRGRSDLDGTLGLLVRDLDRQTADRLELPKPVHGVLVTRVEPMSSSFDAGVERGVVLLEINRARVESAADFHRLARAARPGDVLALYLYVPDLEQRRLVTVRVEDR
jgi:serine protease Do